eukprot:TRINITY_DN9_c0_g1_i1.p1 TRINITY_DN9_c0_g1~~TRINITY_DN9_c0_g1_i1.p1  ORF type:complete len:976 (+),score=342.20 TRINITY_DN9_c0_g1_i1:89-2929(+)
MGTCSSVGHARNEAAQALRPDRSYEQILKAEGPDRIKQLLRHMKNVVPHLVKEAEERHTMLGKGARDFDGALQSLMNTLRDIIIRYSCQCKDHARFESPLKPVEAMHVLNAFFEKHRADFTYESSSSDVRSQLLAHFEQVYQEHRDTLGKARGIAWADVVDRTVLFMLVDKDGGGTLDQGEINRIIHENSIGIRPETLKRRMAEADASRDGRLDYGEYLSFYASLTYSRYLRQHVFGDLYSDRRNYMEEEEFTQFLTEVQNDQRARDPAARKDFYRRLVDRSMGCISKEGNFRITDAYFQDFMTSLPSNEAEDIENTHNSALDPEKTRKVYHDMQQPMTDYFIASSHNTYLTTHQLWGASSEWGYENALALGCRCVELDVWNGPGGQPVVTHGHTAVTKVSFAKCIKTIADWAFKVSPYPVILSLEVHTNQAQQKRMGEIMKQYFTRTGPRGSIMRGLRPPIAFTNHQPSDPSFTPEGLKGFILVKGKMLGAHDPGFDQHLQLVMELNLRMDTALEMVKEAGADDEEDDEAGVELSAEQQKELQSKIAELKAADDYESPVSPGSPVTSPPTVSPPGASPPGASPSQNQSLGATGSFSQSQSHNQSMSVRRPVVKKAKKVKVAPELSSCVWMKSVHYRGYEETVVKKQGHHWDVSSFTETTVAEFWEKEKHNFTKVNQVVFSRVYPAGSRVASDNYHPQKAWNMGCQIVALNYQLGYNRSAELRYNLGKFCDNGRSGYLLKPDYLRGAMSGREFGDPCVVTLEVIQAFNLPKPKTLSGMRTAKGEKIDPYVTCWVNGVAPDGPSGSEVRTKIITDNGFNPEFFDVTDPKDCNAVHSGQCAGQSPRAFSVKQQKVNTTPTNLFRWTLKSKSMAVLTVRVMDFDEGFSDPDDFVAEVCVPISVLREGYRVLPLYEEDQYVQIQGCSVLVKIGIEDTAPGGALPVLRSPK